jgi:hypothetical protein
VVVDVVAGAGVAATVVFTGAALCTGLCAAIRSGRSEAVPRPVDDEGPGAPRPARITSAKVTTTARPSHPDRPRPMATLVAYPGCGAILDR